MQSCLTAFDINEFFSAKIRREACFCDHDIGQLKCHSSRHDGIAAMGDIRERSAVDKCAGVL